MAKLQMLYSEWLDQYLVGWVQINLLPQYLYNSIEKYFEGSKLLKTPASEASREVANLFRPDLDSVFRLKSNF